MVAKRIVIASTPTGTTGTRTSDAKNRFGNYVRFHHLDVFRWQGQTNILIEACAESGFSASGISLTAHDAAALRDALNELLEGK